MKRSGFKKLTYAEAIKKQEEARERKMAKSKSQKKENKKRPKADRVKTLKTKLWAIFSKYIRRRWADQNGMVMTCDGLLKHWKETHCGHLFNNSERSQSLGGNELWYYENNFAPQSSNGNYYNANDSAKMYMLWAIRRYGQEEIDKMQRMKHTPKKFTEEELEELYLYYKSNFDKLES